ncbi:MAG: RNA methyltransferase [Actinomycetota bacterium]|nr:RNA methyltransferase [Actinomycetota bacterium]
MPDVIHIDDPEDERIADFVGLTDPELRRRREVSGGEDGGFFVAEGDVVIRRLLSSSYRIRSFLLTPARLAALGPELAGVDVPVYVAAQPVIDAIAGFHLHRGALASADRRPLPEMATVARSADLLVVTEAVNDHENLGSIFRNAAAFGADAVILDPTSSDPLYRRSVRVSGGQVLGIPFARARAWPGALVELRSMGFEVLALTPGAGATDVRLVERRPRQALLLGAEGPGLSAAALNYADRRVRIPMATGVDSLNVATAGAVALHHLARPERLAGD